MEHGLGEHGLPHAALTDEDYVLDLLGCSL
jgi:hypothetical protein